MEMNAPSGHNVLDDNRQGLMGAPMDRVDGRLKVTGRAPYAYEVREGTKPAYGFIVEASIAKGRVGAIDTALAERMSGVLLVMTHRNAPAQAPYGPMTLQDRYARAKPYLDDDRIEQYGEPVAFVVAESFEEARAAALSIRVDYLPEAGQYDLPRSLDQAEKPEDKEDHKADSALGDFEAAFTSAPVQLDQHYGTPHHIHAQMEPHAALVWWEGERVIVHCSAQLLESAQKCVANTLMIPNENVRIVSRFIGGGFGGKLPIHADVLLSAMASRQLARPVKTALTRQQMFHVTPHRSETIQRLRLGAGTDGKLTAIGHEAWCHSARFDDYYEAAAQQTRSLYAGPNRMTKHRRLHLDLPVADSTRAPGEAVGLLALEVAMDEMAIKLGLDPIEFRIRNEPAEDPEKHVPFSSRQLVQCMQEGARRFGWNRRNAVPGQVRQGRFLIGMGMAAATRSNFLRPSKCKVLLGADGFLVARMSMTDIGTGSYTIFTQIAAEALGLPPGRVRIEIGDSDFPETAGSGGSFGAASAGSALFDACENLRTKIAAAAGMNLARATFADGRIAAEGRTVILGRLAADIRLEADGEIKPGEMAKKYSQQAYGAHFVEVGVDMDSGETRLRRMTGVFAAGRILNMKTSLSQVMGGMIWGAGAALSEEGVVDTRFGYFANHDLAEYHVPVNADIPAVDVVFLPEVDDKTNPLKIKGLGELGICGAGAAVGNAIYNACGVRLRDYPFTLDKVIAKMGRAA